MTTGDGLYLDLYQTPIRGTAVALFNRGEKRPSLDLLLNRTAFSLCGNKAFTDYHPAMQRKKATSRFKREYVPGEIEIILQKIEGGGDPTQRFVLNQRIDPSYDPKRSIFSIARNLTKKEEKPKEMLRDLFTVYPILLIPEEPKENANLDKYSRIPAVLLYDVSEETLRSGYKMGAFEEREGNGIQTILARKREGLADLYAGHALKLEAALRIADLRSGGDQTKEVLEQLRTYQNLYNNLREEYKKIAGQNSLVEEQNKEILNANEELFTRYKQTQALLKATETKQIEIDCAEERMEKIFGRKKMQITDCGDGLIIGHGSAVDQDALVKRDIGQISKDDEKK